LTSVANFIILPNEADQITFTGPVVTGRSLQT